MGNKVSSLPYSKNINSDYILFQPTLTPFIQFTQSQQTNNNILQKWEFLPIQPRMIKQFFLAHPQSEYQLLQSKTFIQISFNKEGQNTLISRYYFQNEKYYNSFLNAVLQLKQRQNIKLYTQMNQYQANGVYYVDMELKYNGTKLQSKLQSLDIQKRILVLIVCCNILDQAKVLRVNPEDFVLQDGRCFLTKIQYNKQFIKIGLDVITLWLFYPTKLKFDEILAFDSATIIQLIRDLQIPMVLKGVLALYSSNDIQLPKVIQFLQGITNRSIHMSFRMDSLHACIYYRHEQLYNSTNKWIYFKQNNHIYFYQVQDQHGHTTSLIRKKNKLFLDDVFIVFDEEQFEVIIPKKGTKHLIRANQFELDSHQSISDITLYQKLPIRIDNGKIYKIQNDILLLQKNLYRIDTKAKTIRQIMKQISKQAIIAVIREKGEPIVIKQSKDIFKQGIKIVGKQMEQILYLAITQSSQSLIAGSILPLQTADFCLEIFNGVFLLFACRSLWILDLNLRCFFSYASINQIKNYQQNKSLHPYMYNYMFQIKNQPFLVEFINNQNSTNAVLNRDKLSILGWRGDEPVCMQYAFEPLTGSLLMINCISLGYNRLLNQLELPKVMTEQSSQTSVYSFKVQPDQVFLYKYQQWKMQGNDFLKIYSTSIESTLQNGYIIQVKCQNVKKTLRQQLLFRNSLSGQLNRREILLLIHKIIEIFGTLHSLKIAHRGFTLQSLCFTKNGKLKLKSWTQPPRIEYISDFKDLFIVIFNVITNNQMDALTSNIVEQYSSKLGQYPQIQKLIIKYIKLAVTQQKRDDIEKIINHLKQHIEIQLLKHVQSKTGNSLVFKYELDTSRLYAMQVYQRKLITFDVFHQQNDKWSFGLDYQCIWNQTLSVLYILTPTNFYSIKIEFDLLQQKQQMKLKAQTQEFLPRKISKPTSILLNSINSLFCFGGIQTTIDDQAIITNSIYVFNLMRLCWQQKQPLCCSLAGATAIPSIDQKLIYLFGGVSADYNMTSTAFKMIIYNIQNGTSVLYVDNYYLSPFSNCLNPPLTFMFSSQNCNENKHHKIIVMQLISGGIYLQFGLQQKQKQPSVLVQKKQDNQQQRQNKKSKIVKFNQGRQNTSIPKDLYKRLPQQINLSSKDKSIYFLDDQKRLLVISMKSGSEASLDVFNI